MLRTFSLAFTAILLTACAVAQRVPEKSQAAAMATPSADNPVPVAVIGVVMCRTLISLVVIDNEGGIHPAPKNATDAQITAITHLVSADHVSSIEIPADCGAFSAQN